MIRLKWWVIIFVFVQGIMLMSLLTMHEKPNVPELKTKCEKSTCDTYLLGKWRRNTAEVKRLVNSMKYPEQNSKLYPGIESFKSHSCDCDVSLRVLTFNIWNINDGWSQRRRRIVEMFDELDFDFVGIQEIRKNPETGVNQLEEIVGGSEIYNTVNITIRRNSNYEYVYAKVQDEKPDEGSEEGIGLLSMHKIVNAETFILTPGTRKVLRVLIDHSSLGYIKVFVTHFSIRDLDQCHHVGQLLEIADSCHDNIPQILLGDFNSFIDFEWPMDYITAKEGSGASSFIHDEANPCVGIFSEYQRRKDYGVFRDIWEEIYPLNEAIRLKGLDKAPNIALGWTFPTFTDERIMDSCRPDRILVREGKGSADSPSARFYECDVALIGDESMSDHFGVLARYCVSNRVGLFVRRWENIEPISMVQPKPKLVMDAVIETNVDTYAGNRKEYIFDGNPKTCWWSSRPVNVGDVISIRLFKPVQIKDSISVYTGDSLGKDALMKGIVEVGFESDNGKIEYLSSREFSRNGTFVATEKSIKNVSEIKIQVLEAQTSWLKVCEVEIN